HRARLPGAAVEQRPLGADAVAAGPLQELHVLQRRAALAHELEHPAAEAVDPDQELAHARARHRLELRLREVRLRLEVEVEVVALQARQQAGEKSVVEDAVDGAEREAAVAPALVAHLGQDALRAFGAERDRLVVEAAKNAVGTLAPPAAFRRLDEER